MILQTPAQLRKASGLSTKAIATKLRHSTRSSVYMTEKRWPNIHLSTADNLAELYECYVVVTTTGERGFLPVVGTPASPDPFHGDFPGTWAELETMARERGVPALLHHSEGALVYGAGDTIPDRVPLKLLREYLGFSGRRLIAKLRLKKFRLDSRHIAELDGNPDRFNAMLLAYLAEVLKTPLLADPERGLLGLTSAGSYLTAGALTFQHEISRVKNPTLSAMHRNAFNNDMTPVFLPCGAWGYVDNFLL